jgi:hypothetical protein
MDTPRLSTPLDWALMFPLKSAPDTIRDSGLMCSLEALDMPPAYAIFRPRGMLTFRRPLIYHKQDTNRANTATMCPLSLLVCRVTRESCDVDHLGRHTLTQSAVHCPIMTCRSTICGPNEPGGKFRPHPSANSGRALHPSRSGCTDGNICAVGHRPHSGPAGAKRGRRPVTPTFGPQLDG